MCNWILESLELYIIESIVVTDIKEIKILFFQISYHWWLEFREKNKSVIYFFAKLWSLIDKVPLERIVQLLQSVVTCNSSFIFQNDGFEKRSIWGIAFLITFWIKWKFVIETLCYFVLTFAVFILLFLLGKGYSLFSASK